MTQPSVGWVVDPDDPRAPPREIWAQLSEAERRAVVESLPSEFPPTESEPPEGDHHYEAYSDARQTLSRWFRERGRSVYVSGNLPVYYPGERMFSPDVIAVMDVDPHPRNSWIVSHEGDRGLDFALEVIVSGRRRKDAEQNVVRYGALGIHEYFVFDRRRLRLLGYRLPARSPRYERLVPQSGRLLSQVLGLHLSLEGEKLRFSLGDAVVPALEELVGKLGRLMDEASQRAEALELALEEEQRRREEEQRRREEEQRRREEAERRLAEVTAELDRLRKESL